MPHDLCKRLADVGRRVGRTYLLPQEVTDFDSTTIVLDNAVDGEMGIDGAHLVLEALKSTLLVHAHISYGQPTYLRYTSDHVDDERLDGAQASYVLAATLPNCECDLVRLALGEPDVHVDVTDILRQGSARARDLDEAGLDAHFDPLRDVELFGLEDVPHLKRPSVSVRSKYIQLAAEESIAIRHRFSRFKRLQRLVEQFQAVGSVSEGVLTL